MKDEKKAIFGLSAAHFVTDIYSPVLPAILPLLILQNNLSYFLAGVIVTVYNLSSSFTQPVMGWLYDRKGLTIPVAFSLLLCAVFIPAIGLVQDYMLILLFAAAAALGHAFFHPAALGLVSRLAKGAERGKLTSFFVVGGNLGFAVGPLFAGFAVAIWGLPGIALLFIPGVLMALVVKKVVPENRPEPHPAPEGRAPVSSPEVSRLPVVMLVVGSAFRAWAIFASVAYLPTFLMKFREMEIAPANIIVSLLLLLGVVGQVAAASLSDRYGRKEMALLGLVACVVPFWIFLSSGGLLSILALLVFGFLLWSSFSVTVTMAHEMMPGGEGLVSGLMLGFAVGAGGAGVAVTGYLADLYSLPLAIGLLLVPIAVAIAFFALLPYPMRTLRFRRRVRL